MYFAQRQISDLPPPPDSRRIQHFFKVNRKYWNMKLVGKVVNEDTTHTPKQKKDEGDDDSSISTSESLSEDKSSSES